MSMSENPVDIVSRGCDADTLFSSDLWFKEPQWLSSANTDGLNYSKPNEQIVDIIQSEIKREEHNHTVSSNAVVFTDTVDFEKIINKYSSFDYLCIIISWLIRFGHKGRKMPVENS